MKIIGAKWFPKVNYYIIKCGCGHEFQYPSDKWIIKCPICGIKNNVELLRNNIKPGDIKI